MHTSYQYPTSHALFARAQAHIPGGVNSPVRAFKSVGGQPVFMQRALGAYLYDADGNRYLDYINSWGPMILGHGHPEVVAAIQQQAAQALSFGAPTEAEILMAELVKSLVPNVELLRLVSSGTEACLSALRVARGYTGRNKLIKFTGCYHGHADPFLVKAGSGVATFGIQHVPGVTASTAADTLTADYNNLAQVAQLLADHPEQVAAIIIEPVAGNMGCVPPEPGFLAGLRQLCDQHGAVLIFDEVMTGFRLAPGGAQERLGIQADLLTFGKVIGGGLPVGAFGGKRAIMEQVAPLGSVYQAGTLSGNPVAVAAGYTTLRLLQQSPSIYQQLDQVGHQLREGLHQVLRQKGVAHTINQVGSMISVHFGEHRVTDFATAAACDIPLFNRLFHHLLGRGVYLPPSAYESWFLSTALTPAHIDQTLEAVASF
ncbi:MAG: glutamate-1-semialdehyde 2,1-aminomutase [Bernardetiaceae bacterium]|jgi:glutamate-1-semialdehyde 2,1-aminomutase|nr:glutamate-1-semialdehyde 2,1-aminomutase [Bernardetiaceae bacterium]